MALHAPSRVICPLDDCVASWDVPEGHPGLSMRRRLYAHLTERHGLRGRERMLLVEQLVLPLRVADDNHLPGLPLTTDQEDPS